MSTNEQSQLSLYYSASVGAGVRPSQSQFSNASSKMESFREWMVSHVFNSNIIYTYGAHDQDEHETSPSQGDLDIICRNPESAKTKLLLHTKTCLLSFPNVYILILSYL